MNEMNKRGSMRPLKWLIILLALMVVFYGVMAIRYSIEQNTFRVPQAPLVAGVGRLQP